MISCTMKSMTTDGDSKFFKILIFSETELARKKVVLEKFSRLLFQKFKTKICLP